MLDIQPLWASALLILLAVLAVSPKDGRAEEAAAGETQYTWDLAEFYASKSAWTTEVARLRVCSTRVVQKTRKTRSALSGRVCDFCV